MLEIQYTTKNAISIANSDKKEVIFELDTQKTFLEEYDITFPGEYEKSGILVEVKEYNSTLFYNFLIEGRRVVIIADDSFEIKEEIVSFFGDIDVLLIIGTKNAAKLFENIEAKLVIPFGEGKDIFLNTLGQHIEEVNSYKVKQELSIDSTDFVNLAV